MRVLCYAQHLSGVGHFVRMRALARGLACAQEVHLVDGGRPVPRSDADAALPRIALPVIFRSGGALVAADGAPAATVLAARARLLAAATAELRPDVVLIDHYPFSKWELEGEIAAMIAAARGAVVLCSLRDIAPRTRQEDVSEARYAERVLATLAARFDGVLVHADPAFTRLDEHFGNAAALPVPVRYTGFVAEPLGAPTTAPAPAAVLSCGGGSRSLPFLLAAIAAFRDARDAGALAGIERVHVFASAFPGAEEQDALRAAAAADPRVVIEPFSGDFAARLPASALSISRAGYNTTVQLLQADVPSVVVPDPRMSDQGSRAARLAALGLAEVVSGDPPPVATLAAALSRALVQPRRPHAFALDGVAKTCAILAGWTSTPTSASRSTSR